MKNFILRYSAVCLLLALASCTSESTMETQHTFTVSDENGVKLARTEGGPKYEGELFEYSEVVRLQQDGSYRRSIGGPGDGPGEFQSPRYLTNYDNVLSIYDGRLRRTSHYHPDGAFLDSHSFLQAPPGPRLIQVWDYSGKTF